MRIWFVAALLAGPVFADSAAADLAAAKEEIARLRALVRDLGGNPDAAPTRKPKTQPPRWGSSMHMLYPSAVTVPSKHTYGRIIHISHDSLQAKANGNRDESEPFHNALGLDSQVRIGLGAGYGISNRLEFFGQRSVGRDIQTGTRVQDFGGFSSEVPDLSSYDTYDLLLKYQWLNELDNGLNLAILGGTSIMLEDDESAIASLDFGVMAERSLWEQRAYFGGGLLYASQSDFSPTTGAAGQGAFAKRHPSEPNSLSARSDGADHTLAIPLTLRLAVTPKLQLFAEAIAPIDGYDTGQGPTLAVGGRLLKLHYNQFVAEYNVFVTNTSNTAFNATLTGGYARDTLDIFGFSISVRY